MVGLNIEKEIYTNATLTYLDIIFWNNFRELKKVTLGYVEKDGKVSVRKIY